MYWIISAAHSCALLTPRINQELSSGWGARRQDGERELFWEICSNQRGKGMEQHRHEA